GHACRAVVVNPLRLNCDAHFASRIHSKGALDTGILFGNFFESVDTFDVLIQLFTPGARSSGRDGVGYLHDNCFQRFSWYFIVVGRNGVYNGLRFAMAAREIGPNQGVSALNLMAERFSDVV